MTQIKEGDKLFIITRQDISNGYQAVQSAHAICQFTFEHREIATEWYEQSNYLALLSVSNEQELIALINKASSHGLRFSVFREPDINNEITAIALEPSRISKKMCSNIPLALNT